MKSFTQKKTNSIFENVQVPSILHEVQDFKVVGMEL
jgi:hypothetical protein